jgi:hypothetical protein
MGLSGDQWDLILPPPRVLLGVCVPRGGGISHELVEGGDAVSNDAHVTVNGGVDSSAMPRVIGVRPLSPPRGGDTNTRRDKDGCG